MTVASTCRILNNWNENALERKCAWCTVQVALNESFNMWTQIVFNVFTLQFAMECFWIRKWIEFIRAITRVTHNKNWMNTQRHILIMRVRERKREMVSGPLERKSESTKTARFFTIFFLYWKSKTTTFWMSYYLYLMFVACGAKVNM